MPRHATPSVPLLFLLVSLGACSPGSEPVSGEDPFLLEDGRKLLGNDEITAVSYSGHRRVPRSVANTHSERILQTIRELKQADPDFEMYVTRGSSRA